jgi:hypothetical protein
MSEASLSSHHLIKYDEVEMRSKREKLTRILSPNFLVYLLKNKLQNYSKVISLLKGDC